METKIESSTSTLEILRLSKTLGIRFPKDYGKENPAIKTSTVASDPERAVFGTLTRKENLLNPYKADVCLALPRKNDERRLTLLRMSEQFISEVTSSVRGVGEGPAREYSDRRTVPVYRAGEEKTATDVMTTQQERK
ncbi:hypothetical protein WA026_022874 [Henosepilachna vigintioctopunctata]|uniref:Uncharacterized protein n=1 Tax=Henosepilachna vigintioctopunctata TaxID=420089 RepID=A0AAW1UDB8_9CUCU